MSMRPSCLVSWLFRGVGESSLGAHKCWCLPVTVQLCGSWTCHSQPALKLWYTSETVAHRCSPVKSLWQVISPSPTCETPCSDRRSLISHTHAIPRSTGVCTITNADSVSAARGCQLPASCLSMHVCAHLETHDCRFKSQSTWSRSILSKAISLGCSSTDWSCRENISHAPLHSALRWFYLLQSHGRRCVGFEARSSRTDSRGSHRPCRTHLKAYRDSNARRSCWWVIWTLCVLFVVPEDRICLDVFDVIDRSTNHNGRNAAWSAMRTFCPCQLLDSPMCVSNLNYLCDFELCVLLDMRVS